MFDKIRNLQLFTQSMHKKWVKNDGKYYEFPTLFYLQNEWENLDRS